MDFIFLLDPRGEIHEDSNFWKILKRNYITFGIDQSKNLGAQFKFFACTLIYFRKGSLTSG